MLFVCGRINLRFRRLRRLQRMQIGELNASIEDSLLGQKVVKAFTNEDLEERKFAKGNELFFSLKKSHYVVMAWFHTSIKMFDAIIYLITLVAGSLFIHYGKIQAADLVAFLLYVTTLLATVRRIVDFMEQFQMGITGIDRFLQLMDAEIEIFDEPGAVDLHDIKGEIVFKNVSFEYPDDHNEVFKNLNLTIHPGERVQQDVYLFSGTVFENIVYGRPDATREEVIEAAKKAGAHEFVSELKDGYDTYIGERGVKLSGGQKQRISIARVFLKNPPIIILDEATSALDNESEYLVAKSLEKLSEGRTTLTVAHRLSTIRNADRIMVLTEEGIVEEGNHDELIEKKGMYYKFYEMANQLK